MSRLNQAKARRQLARDHSRSLRVIQGIGGLGMTFNSVIFDEAQFLPPMMVVATRPQDWDPRQRPLIWREPQ